MGIPARCESCSATFNVPDRFAGKRVRCVLCGQPVSVAESNEPIRTSSLQTPDEETDFDWLAQAEREAEAVDRPLTAACPHCAAEVQTTTQFLRREIECPTCEETFRVHRTRSAAKAPGKSASSRRPGWLNIVADGAMRRELQLGRTFSADDPHWSQVQNGLTLIYLGLWVQCALAAFAVTLVATMIVGVLILIVSAGGGALVDVYAGGSGYQGGPMAVGLLLLLLGGTVWLILQIAFLFDRLWEGLAGLLAFALLLAIVVATQGAVLILLGVLGAAVLYLAFAVILVGGSRCIAIPGHMGARPAVIASVVLLAVSVLASVAAGILLLSTPLQTEIDFLVRIPLALAFVAFAAGKAALAWGLRRMAISCEEPKVTSQSELCLIVQILLAICGLGALAAANPKAALAVMTLLSVVCLVDLFHYVRLVNGARCLIR